MSKSLKIGNTALYNNYGQKSKPSLTNTFSSIL